MASEATRQKSFLASGKLGGLGLKLTGKPPDFKGLEAVLVQYGELFAKEFAEELVKADANASGALASSIRFEFEKRGKTYTVSLFMSDYYKFVDEGVQGVDSSKNINTTSPFKFKFVYPSKSHVAALEKWVREKNVTAIITAPKGISSELSPKKLATAIGIATKRRGLKATFFRKKVIERNINNLKRDILSSIGDDITVNILFE